MVATALGFLAFGAGQARAEPSDCLPETPRPGSVDTQDPVKAKKLDAVNVQGTSYTAPVSPKFTAPPVDIAQSVSVVSQALIHATAATSLQDALRNVPGITFGAGEGGNPLGDRPSIRGFNSTSDTFVDGMRDIGIQTRDVFDVEQIEVVKGPDSSLAGRATGGGSINLVSKVAKADNFADASFSYGTAQQRRATLDANWAINSEVAARVNILGMKGGVPGRDAAVKADKFGFAPTITFGLGTPTRWTLGYYHLLDDGTPDYGIPISTVTGAPITGVSTKTFYGLVNRDFRHTRTDIFSGSVEHTINDVLTLRSQLRSADSTNNYVVTSPDDFQGNTANGFVFRQPWARAAEDTSLISQTDLFGSADTGGVVHAFDVGVELSQEKLKQAGNGNYNGYFVSSPSGLGSGESCGTPGSADNAAIIASHECTSLTDPDPYDRWNGTTVRNPSNTYFTTKDIAAYAIDTMTLSPHWKVNVGGRWDNYNTHAVTPGDSANNASSHETFFSYQASLIYKPLEHGSIYLTNSTATTPQALGNGDQDQASGGTDFSPANTNVKPLKTDTVELGSKWSFLQDRLLLSGDVFSETRDNAQIEVQPGLYAVAGKTRVNGAEISASGNITAQWSVMAGYSYLDGTLVKGSYSDTALGKPLVDTPRNTVSLWTTYAIDPAVTVGGGAYYRDRQVGYYGGFTPTDPAEHYIPSYWRFDAMASWQVNANLALQLNLQNLFDKTYFNKVYYQYALPAAGRTLMLTADIKFR